MKKALDTEYLTRRCKGNGLGQLILRPHRANTPCGGQISGDYKIWLLSFTSAYNDTGAWCPKLTDNEVVMSDFLLLSQAG